MKFFMMSLPDEKTANQRPSPEMGAKVAKLIEDETKRGILVATGAMLPVSMGGARVKSENGVFSVVDGPFTETKELIAGWAIVEVASLEEALEASRRFFAVVGDGHGEIRRIEG